MKMLRKKRIAVIGGGFSGLNSIRALKEEGMEPVCYEKTSSPGGTWCYREQAIHGVPSIMPSTIINHSKEIGALSNFPPKKEYPNYMRHAELYQYFKDIGESCDCFRHMIYNREVISIRRSQNYDKTGQWTVKVKNTEDGEIMTDDFDGVMVSVGHITYPKMCEFPGMDNFKGDIIHSHSLKEVDKFSNKRICVIGIGCSALDAAVETSTLAKQVYLSTRSGSWIFPRVGPHGVPMDYALLRRYLTTLQEIVPINVSSKFIEKLFLNPKFNHDLYNLRPQYPVFCKDPSINDTLPLKLISGSVILKKNVKYFVENGVMFEGDEKITEVDTVIMATGYEWKFPFLEDDIVTTEKDGRINLYKCMWSPKLKHQSLVIIGFVLPFGPGFPLGEMQCRWVAQVFSGKIKLPSKEIMMKDIIKRHEQNVKRYRPSDKVSIRVDYVPYMDDIASQFGAKPNLLKMLITDPQLFQACFFGPCLSYQYRLQGPHKWKGARKAILSAKERMKTPLTGNVGNRGNKRNAHNFTLVILLFFASLLINLKGSFIASYLIAFLLLQYISSRSFMLKYFLAVFVMPFFVVWDLNSCNPLLF
ncbi:dimethylaniline monooxygenase 5 [Trichonephila clavata]|uniref:Flavin-containing monooxygenase n=1 Tax=Trichonephila clavata TaxID=2740835 RepID=A0A8X6M1U5_TRICU|nr:dimethylaniline monooxygenase 5 [Trichonephila clavata]